MRVRLEMPCAVAPGASPLGLLWPEEGVDAMATAINVGYGPNGVEPRKIFDELGLNVIPVRGTAKVDRTRRHLTGYLYIQFEAEVPDANEVARIAQCGIEMLSVG